MILIIAFVLDEVVAFILYDGRLGIKSQSRLESVNFIGRSIKCQRVHFTHPRGPYYPKKRRRTKRAAMWGEGMSIGLILLVAAAILVLFGVAQRVLDKLRLTDRQALLFVALLFVGGLIPDIPLGNLMTVNIGGALVPLGLCIYLWVKAGTAKERIRSLAAALVTGAAVFFLARWLPDEPEGTWIDPNYVYGIVGGVVAYLFGRSRRGAFIAGILGVMLADITQSILIWRQGVDQVLHLGGAGALDVIVISGLLAVLLAELVGELLERATRGNRRDHNREFRDGEFVERKEKGK